MSFGTKVIVLFVEGDTEKEFFKLVINYLKSKSEKVSLPDVKIINLKGIGRFESKVKAKLKNEILINYNPNDIIVFFCYDTDVFELGKKPSTSWNRVEKDTKDLGITTYFHIKAKSTIEDWFIEDYEGICDFLKITAPKKRKKDSGLNIIKMLFKSGKKPKIYQKGSYTHKFLEKVSIEKIINKLNLEFKDLKSFF